MNVSLDKSTQFGTAALRTLESIRQKMEFNRFGLSELARVLGRMGASSILLAELKWLVQNGYLRKDVSAVYALTDKGKQYSPPQPERRDDQPMFQFVGNANSAH